MSRPLAIFDRISIINLAERTDRRREILHEIERIGGFDHTRMTFFDAIRPPDRGDFASIGARGCFLSHLGALKAAAAQGARTVLVLEDDFDFSRDFAARGATQLASLASRRWDMYYGAHVLTDGGPALDPNSPIDPARPIMTASFVGFQDDAIARTIAFLEQILTRPAGSPEYGPMHVDGAYSVFRALNPDIVAYAAAPQLGYQRSSRSNIAEDRTFFDRIPALRISVNLARRLRATIRRPRRVRRR